MFLFVDGKTQDDAAEDIGVEDLLSVWFLESLAPVRGSEFEDAALGPTGQQAQEVAHIAQALDLVEPTARQQGHEDGIDVRAVVAGVDPDLAQSTVEFLGLNRALLVRLRATLLQELDAEALIGTADEAIAEAILAVASDRLLPDARGCLLPFWSTIRYWAGPEIEVFLQGNAQSIPGFSS